MVSSVVADVHARPGTGLWTRRRGPAARPCTRARGPLIIWQWGRDVRWARWLWRPGPPPSAAIRAPLLWSTWLHVCHSERANRLVTTQVAGL